MVVFAGKASHGAIAVLRQPNLGGSRADFVQQLRRAAEYLRPAAGCDVHGGEHHFAVCAGDRFDQLVVFLGIGFVDVFDVDGDRAGAGAA